MSLVVLFYKIASEWGWLQTCVQWVQLISDLSRQWSDDMSVHYYVNQKLTNPTHLLPWKW